MTPNPLTADLDGIISRAEPLLRRIAGERIFITGGTGFIGRWLLEALCWANDRLRLHLGITALSRSPVSFMRGAVSLSNSSALTWCHGDIRSFNPPCGSFPLVIHAAGATGLQLDTEKAFDQFDTIVTGTRRALEFADRADCAAFLLTSSGAVYGRQPHDLERVAEDYSGAPNPNSGASVYGEGKRAAELLCAASGLQTKIARGFAFVGPYLPLNKQFAIGNFIRDALQGKPIEIRSDGKAYRSYLYAADMVVWLLKILLDAPANRPYNVGSDKAITIAEIAGKVAMLTHATSIKIVGEASGGHADRYVPSITRAREELGLEDWTSVDQALERTVKFTSGLFHESK